MEVIDGNDSYISTKWMTYFTCYNVMLVFDGFGAYIFKGAKQT